MPEGLFDESKLKIIPVELNSEMKKSYLDYAMSVIVGRALPDVRDGLKPVHRRIIYTMYEAGLTPEKIDISGVCTMCHSDKFYSYRTHKDGTGRQVAVIMIKG